MVSEYRTYKPADYQKLLEFYRKVDGDFNPPLSQRTCGIEGHISNILSHNGTFVLYEDDDALKGAIGFFPTDESKTVVRFTFLAFDKTARGSTKLYKLAKFLVEQRHNLGYSSVTKIEMRTGSEKSANSLRLLGCNLVREVKGDLTDERTTYYFEGSAESISSRICG